MWIIAERAEFSEKEGDEEDVSTMAWLNVIFFLIVELLTFASTRSRKANEEWEVRLEEVNSVELVVLGSPADLEANHSGEVQSRPTVNPGSLLPQNFSSLVENNPPSSSNESSWPLPSMVETSHLDSKTIPSFQNIMDRLIEESPSIFEDALEDTGGETVEVEVRDTGISAVAREAAAFIRTLSEPDKSKNRANLILAAKQIKLGQLMQAFNACIGTTAVLSHITLLGWAIVNLWFHASSLIR
ncbi:hypothetical protein G7Y89_g6746 [Cudoniella acicularis]|uniref:Uncharacterized protein n=1 Tax=Cudoniella acicularis TaxID=354080 RepID=A0A8H4RM65_9HELO|nr:hypothetical protein G7Y89_g6746 [Cudoniella acicularis]